MYSTALVRLYRYYRGMTQIDTDGNRVDQLPDLTTFWRTMRTLYWSMFNMSPRESADVVIENQWGGEPINHHGLTQLVGTIIFGSYHSLTEIILINIFIAVLGETYGRVQVT
ncbi:hypothetical protein LAZ67_3001830 [Cordylochernes scorpioides]|uniref:Ion transport domain-containing protein n=1 Tax=Cordylochernes scorpioides TaxID=51811 RepID=A0ABY6K8Z6_9ARAC|nr:hypothetical protein LAZ67_3001830 [Cordylochernes scorpioides]